MEELASVSSMRDLDLCETLQEPEMTSPTMGDVGIASSAAGAARSGELATAPFFSVVISTYNRRDSVSRCLESCLRQTFADFEVVVVDDGSTDGTLEMVRERWGDRVRVVRHPRNRGISPSRFTGVSHSRGEWLVVLDSDWELLPQSLDRLREIIDGLPADIRVVRSRLAWDDGRVTPAFVPDGPVGYEERIRWVEREGGLDAARCLHRSVFDRTPYFQHRRGLLETLYELNLAQNETSLYVSDVLGIEHATPDSYLRSVDRSKLIPRLLNDAPDTLWMAEDTLRRHGAALEQNGPRQYREMLRIAALQAFLSGRRATGLQYAWASLKVAPLNGLTWATTLAGLLGPRASAYAVFAHRRLAGR
jgi:glycosyltransferase involved in cell wall biosynthesis